MRVSILVLLALLLTTPAKATPEFFARCLVRLGIYPDYLPPDQFALYITPYHRVLGAGGPGMMIARAKAHVVALSTLRPRDKAKILDDLFFEILRRAPSGWRYHTYIYDGGWVYYGRADRLVRIDREGAVYEGSKDVNPSLFRSEEEDRLYAPPKEYFASLVQNVRWIRLYPPDAPVTATAPERDI